MLLSFIYIQSPIYITGQIITCQTSKVQVKQEQEVTTSKVQVQQRREQHND
jgi:hypothetical protein